MACVFAYLMETGAETTDQAIFSDTFRLMEAKYSRLHHYQSKEYPYIAQHSFEIALR